MELKDLNGIGEKRIAALNGAGIMSCKDLISYIPYKYYDFSDVNAYDRFSTVPLYYAGTVIEEPKCIHIKKLNYVIAKICCKISNKTFTAVWYNQPFMKSVLKVGEEYFFFGKPNKNGWLVVSFYKCVSFFEGSSLAPVYKNIGGMGSKIISSFVKQILEEENISSYLDNEEELKLIDAYKIIHFPNSLSELDKAKERISLEDMIELISVQNKFDNSKKLKPQRYKNSLLQKFYDLCPFKLTNSQTKALSDIYLDLCNIHPMNRLLLGDVGSGKTIVAFGACYMAYLSGYQSAILAPTEILAKQHYINATRIFGSHVTIELITSNMKKNERRNSLEKIKNGEANIIIGTHSVFSNDVEFNNLSLVITDEQHRFGVSQRAMLSNKSVIPDTLIMSATPIPRSLALVFFGDLKLSKLTERPNGESKIKTNILSYTKESDMLEFIKNEIKNNSKCFIVAPRIDEDENSDIKSVDEIYKELSKDNFFTNKLQYLHGKQSDELKNTILSKFKSGEYPLLISTTVVEVGVDVPDANILVIHNADRFGLASLHQLRGRVGRNGKEGYCFCLTNTNSKTALDRLKLFKSTNDGFKLSEEDYKMRGSGTILGTHQHGVSEIMSSLYFSLDGYEKAKKVFYNLNDNQKQLIENNSNDKFGKLFNNVVLN